MSPITSGTPTLHPTFQPNTPQTIISRDTHPSSSTQLSPILAARLPQVISGPEPQYAEDLTPLKLRRRRQRPTFQNTSTPASISLTPGLSLSGFTTEDGEIYRGATYDPRLGPPAVEEDALTIAESSNSSSSSWSWASDIQRGRRATMAAIGRFGERLGVRRGSGGSDTSSDTGTLRSRSRSVSVGRRLSRRITRTNTRESISSDIRPRRQHLPRRREFTLLLPPTSPSPATLEPISRISTPSSSERADAVPYPPDRLICTPDLPSVLDRIRSARLAAGVLLEPPSVETTHRRGRHTRGHPHPVHGVHGHPSHIKHRPKLKHGHHSFPNPPLPRPGPVHMKSRLDALRTGSHHPQVPRPKSVSDLMGMANPYTAPDNSGTSPKDGSPDLTPTLSREDLSAEHKGCWWLDVSCPGWEDLRDIGEVLGLHPLTLEDVLQQDPREKFDVFDRLGYYFVVVRALDEEYFKYTPGSSTTLVGPGEKAYIDSSPSDSPQLRANNEKKKEGRRRGWGMGRTSGKGANKEGEKVEIVEDNPGKEGLEGVGVGAVNLYLVVFADGIVSFHFDDITKHTKYVLDRILSSTSVQSAPGSDWIAHGLLDSVVDAFFPLIRYVDGEVDDIDSLTVDPSVDPKSLTIPSPAVDQDGLEMTEKGVSYRPPPLPPVKRLKKAFEILKKAKDLIPTIHLPHAFIYVKLFLLPVTSAVQKPYEHPDSQVMSRATMLRHMTEMRKLVTGLTRLLGTKHQVIGLMRKRVAESGEGVAEYIGDIEDHILLLQNSLIHYEYILSHCQPAYISQLNLGFKIVKGRTDEAILALSTVAIGILPMQFIISIFSMNVQVPHNGDPDNSHDETDGSPAPLNWWGGVVVSLVLVSALLVLTIRYWRWAARVKWAKTRNETLPNMWDGFWGFR